MKKQILMAAAMILVAISTARADFVTNKAVGNLLNAAELAYSSAPVLDLFNDNVDFLSMQTVVSTVTGATAQTFTDGTTSTNTIQVISTQSLVGMQAGDTMTVVNNAGLVAAAATDTIIITSITGLPGSSITITVNGGAITLVANTDFQVGASTVQAVANLAAKIGALPLFSAVTGTLASSTTVVVTYDTPGTFGNTIGISANFSTAMSVVTSSMTGGVDNSSFSINNQVYTQGIDYFKQDTSSNSAINVKNLINTRTDVVASTGGASTIWVQAVNTGLYGNAFKMNSSTGALAVSSPSFTTGTNWAQIRIGTVTLNAGLVQGPDTWAVGTSSLTTAINIASSVVNSPELANLVASSVPARFGIVYSTSINNGAQYNYPVWVSTPALSLGANQFFGGTNSGVNTAAGSLGITNYKFGKAQAVLFTKSAGTPPGTLLANTTYYVVPVTIFYPNGVVVDASNFQLASTQAKAIAGTADVGISTQTSTGGGSFTLTPLALSGIASWKWQVSNDNANWNDLTTTNAGVSVSSVTFVASTTTATTSNFWDFGEPQFHWLRLNILYPGNGALSFVVTGYEKQRMSK